MHPFAHLRAQVILLVGSMLFGAYAAQAELLTGRVVHVSDGDTFMLDTGLREPVTVRVAEIDAPEGDQPYGNESRRALTRMIDREFVKVDVKTIDDYGRTVGRPFTADLDVAREMVRTGAAWAYRRYLIDRELVNLENGAREAKVGLWGASAQPVPPWDWRHRQTAVPSHGSRSSSSGACDIKGNISSSGERIYHLPGQRYYAATQIDAARGERWFCSETDARGAGWRRART